MVHLGKIPHFLKMAAIFQKKFKMSKIYHVDYSHIHQHFQFHANPANGFETRVLNKNELTINQISQDRKTLNNSFYLSIKCMVWFN